LAKKSLLEVIDDLTQLLASFTIPIYRNDERDRPEQVGSCFIVHSGAHHYLVSAAHVLEEARELYFYIAPSQTRKLSGLLALSRWTGNREKDPIDVGVIRLTKEGLPPYRDLKKVAVLPSYLRPNDSPRDGKQYAIVGYPETKNRADTATRTVNAKAYSYRNRALAENLYATHGLSAATNIVLPLRPKKSFDSEGKHTHFPKPQGMSGSPIWLLFDDEATDFGRVCPIVAIGTKYRKGLGIIGTDVAVAMDMMDGLSREPV
jgi:hypothetical protein